VAAGLGFHLSIFAFDLVAGANGIPCVPFFFLSSYCSKSFKVTFFVILSTFKASIFKQAWLPEHDVFFTCSYFLRVNVAALFNY
jgi:hypothetical protein